MSDIAIKIEHLTKIYKIFDKPTDRIKEALNPFGKRYSKDFYALNDLNIEIKKGETVGIIGKNGAGKSTLLKIITGVLTPTSGNIQVNGRIASLLELGAGFNLEMTGIENIYMNGSIMGYSKEDMDARLQNIIDFADIGDFINQPVKMYSSGMFARLAFALNTFVEPDILIVDEALSVGDVFFQNKCFKKMEDLRNSGITILFVSHDMPSVRMLCDKCMWLENGQKKMYGDVKYVSEEYFKYQLHEQNKLSGVNTADKNEIVETITQYENMTLPLIPDSNGLKCEDVIIKTFFFEENGKRTSILKVEKKYIARMAVEFLKDYNNLIFGFVVENSKGINVLAFNTFIYSDKKNISALSGNTIIIDFEFMLPKISRGVYVVSPAVAVGTQQQHRQLTWLENCQSVEIINDGYNLSMIEIDAKLKSYSIDSNKVKYVRAEV